MRLFLLPFLDLLLLLPSFPPCCWWRWCGWWEWRPSFSSYSLCGAFRDHDLEGREVTWTGQDKLASDIPKVFHEIRVVPLLFGQDPPEDSYVILHDIL
jgi:hypothetical protein